MAILGRFGSKASAGLPGAANTPRQGIQIALIPTFPISQLQKQLRELTPNQIAGAARPAASFALIPAKRTAKQLTPLGKGLTPAGETRPHLRDQIRVKRMRKSDMRNPLIIWAGIGYQYEGTPHAHFVEEGTGSFNIGNRGSSQRPFQITAGTFRDTKTGKTILKTDEGQFLGSTVMHPGAKPRQPITQAVKSNLNVIQQRFVKKIGQEMTKRSNKIRQRIERAA